MFSLLKYFLHCQGGVEEVLPTDREHTSVFGDVGCNELNR